MLHTFTSIFHYTNLKYCSLICLKSCLWKWAYPKKRNVKPSKGHKKIPVVIILPNFLISLISYSVPNSCLKKHSEFLWKVDFGGLPSHYVGSCLSSQHTETECAWALQTSRVSGCIPQRQPILLRVTRTSSASAPVRTIFCLSSSIFQHQVQLGNISFCFLCMVRSWSCEWQVTHCVHSTGCLPH